MPATPPAAPAAGEAAPPSGNYFTRELAKLQQDEDCLVYMAKHASTWQILFFYKAGFVIDKKLLLAERPSVGNMGMHRQNSYDKRGAGSPAGDFTVKGSTVEYTLHSKSPVSEMEWAYTCSLLADGGLAQFYGDAEQGTLAHCGNFAGGAFYPNENFAAVLA